MPENSKKPPQPARASEDDPKLYAHAYAARLAKQVAAEFEGSSSAIRRGKKTSAKAAKRSVRRRFGGHGV